MITFFRTAFLFAALLGLMSGAVLSQDQPTSPTTEAGIKTKVVVATRVLPPFIIEDGSNFSGFSADLWKELAQRAGVEFTWKKTGNVKEILAAVESGAAQVGIAAISITAAREQQFDFSQPMFESGLQIMVQNKTDGDFSLRQIFGFFTRGAMPYLLGLLALLIIVPGHMVWFAERRHKEPAFSMHYFPGIFQAMAWALSAAAGQQNNSLNSTIGRLLSVAAIFISLLFLTYWQAELTSSFTVEQLQGGINGPEDLPGKKVGATTGSTSATYISTHGSTLQEFQKIEEAIAALEAGKLDAVVFDAPVLLYYAANNGRGKVRVVGPIFRKENYGILFPRDSELRKRVNEALLKMREDGAYDNLYDRWFGALSGLPD